MKKKFYSIQIRRISFGMREFIWCSACAPQWNGFLYFRPFYDAAPVGIHAYPKHSHKTHAEICGSGRRRKRRNKEQKYENNIKTNLFCSDIGQPDIPGIWRKTSKSNLFDFFLSCIKIKISHFYVRCSFLAKWLTFIFGVGCLCISGRQFRCTTEIRIGFHFYRNLCFHFKEISASSPFTSIRPRR